MRGDVDDGVGSGLQFLLDVRQPERLVFQHRAAIRCMNRRQFLLHVFERRKSLHRFGQAREQRLNPVARDRAQIGQGQPWRSGDGVTADQKVLTVMQRRQRDGVQRPIRHDYQRLNPPGVQCLLQWLNQPAMKLLRQRQIFAAGALFQSAPELAHRGGERGARRRRGDLLETVGSAQEQFQPVGQQNRVQNGRLRRRSIQSDGARLQRRHTVIPEIILHLGGFQRLHHGAGGP